MEHLRAVARAVSPGDERIVAWLHDTVEDTPLSLQDLRQLGFPDRVVDAVRLLTHVPGISEGSYLDHIAEIRDATTPGAELARVVKRADMAHNADPSRGSERDVGWLRRRYERGIAILDGEG